VIVRRTRWAVGAAALACVTTGLVTQAGGAAGPARVDAANPIAGTPCSAFPDDNWWHADVRDLPVHALSAQWLSHMSPGSDLHPDFGPSYGDGPNYGIPITVVRGSHAKVKVRFQYASESDRGTYPLGPDTRIEGGKKSDGDRHAVIVDRDNCVLYETWHTRKTKKGWTAGSGAAWSLRSNQLRREGWTSADAAGLPILPGLLRWSEVRDDTIDHAIRFTTDVSSRWHLWPARHDAGSQSSHHFPPMGARFRLKAGWTPQGFSPEGERVVAAMKTYGMVLADNGSPWFFQGEQNAAWPERLIDDLKDIPASAFEAVDTASLRVSANSAAVK